jgi:hypothetical protein
VRVLRGRPVAFALWSEAHKKLDHCAIGDPPPAGEMEARPRAAALHMLTPGIEARHVKGTGAERLMFAFSRGGEELKVYGRKFPVFDNASSRRSAGARRRRRHDPSSTCPIPRIPLTRASSRAAGISCSPPHGAPWTNFVDANVPSAAFPGELLADVIPPEVIATLAVIEQTDDEDFLEKGRDAFDEVLSQYGLKREEAYRYSVSSAKALGQCSSPIPHGNGTYSLVVRLCRGAQLDPSFERGATRSAERHEGGRLPAGHRAIADEQ